MSTRGLVTAALVLAGLLVLLGVAGAHRLGYLSPAPRPTWEFRNSLCECRPGTRVVLRPGAADQERRRYWFLRAVREPAPDDLSAADHDVGRFAHARASVEVRRPGEDGWFFDGVAFFSYRQLGALTHGEFLEEIKLVRQEEDGGRQRPLLRARFATATRSESWYYFDPESDPAEAASRGFGWVRVERHASGAQSEVYYLSAAGFRDPP